VEMEREETERGSSTSTQRRREEADTCEPQGGQLILRFGPSIFSGADRMMSTALVGTIQPSWPRERGRRGDGRGPTFKMGSGGAKELLGGSRPQTPSPPIGWGLCRPTNPSQGFCFGGEAPRPGGCRGRSPPRNKAGVWGAAAPQGGKERRAQATART
jgi:hypothetical protein